MKNKELVYNVYIEDFNSKKIKVFNIFNSYRFYEDLLKINKKYKDNFEEFSQQVKSSIMYSFWSKCEYEIILTSWPAYVNSEEIDRLVSKREEKLKKYNHFYIDYVNLTVGEKIDVYDQIMLNWDIFIKYLWENKNLIKKRK